MAAHHTGTTVTSAGLILAATFGVAGLTGATTQIKELGAAIALGVLLDTFLVRTLLVPAIVVLCRRYNWWPSKLSRLEPAGSGAGQPAPAPAGPSRAAKSKPTAARRR
jgi:RND superfamily putative drug exporter